MARLLLITHEFNMNGAAWILCRLGIHLAAQGHSVTVFASHENHGPLLRHFETSGIPVIREGHTSRFDLVIGNTIEAAPLLLKFAPYSRTLWWLHEGEVGVSALVKEPSWIAAFQKCTHVVFQTRFQRDDIYRSFLYNLPSDRFSVIPNGVGPIPKVEPVPRQKRLRILCVGSVYPRKRQQDLIGAVHALNRKDVECVLVGKCVIPFEPAVQSIVQARPNVFRLIGELDNAAAQAWFAGSDIFCLPSASESQPLVAFEAAGHRLPLILTDLPAYQGIWRHGHNCLMHAVGDVQVLSGMLNMLLHDASLRTRLGEAAAVTADSFRFDTFASNFEALINRLAGVANHQPK